MGGRARLTEKERRTMELLSKGKRYKEIAHLEGMSISGVAQRVERIKNKFGVARRLEALAIYLLGQRH